MLIICLTRYNFVYLNRNIKYDMVKMRDLGGCIMSPDSIEYGVRLGEYRGNSTSTEIYIKSDSMQEKEISFTFYGTIEREGLVFILDNLSQIIKTNLKK